MPYEKLRQLVSGLTEAEREAQKAIGLFETLAAVSIRATGEAAKLRATLVSLREVDGGGGSSSVPQSTLEDIIQELESIGDRSA